MSKQQETKSHRRRKQLKTLFGKRDNQAKLFFLFLAIFLWLIINLSKEEGYVQTLQFPVEYKNLPENKELIGELPEDIEVRFKAAGFDLLKYQLNSFDPLEVDVTSMLLSKDGLKAYWVTNDQLSLIQDQLDPDVEVFSISPDTITISYQKLASKKVPIVLNLKQNFDQFTTLYEAPKLEPDSLLITGDEETLSKVDSIITKELKLSGEEGVFDGFVDLVLPKMEKTTFSNEKVKVHLRLAKLTENTLDQQVELRFLPDSVEVVVFPKQVHVKVQLALSDFDKLKAYEVRAYVDVSKALNENQPDFLSVQLDPLPDYVRNYSVEPKRVEYIISKK
jgi:YbbR domain-containing protein